MGGSRDALASRRGPVETLEARRIAVENILTLLRPPRRLGTQTAHSSDSWELSAERAWQIDPSKHVLFPDMAGIVLYRVFSRNCHVPALIRIQT